MAIQAFFKDGNPGIFQRLGAHCQWDGLGSVTVKAWGGSSRVLTRAPTSRHGLVGWTGVGVQNSTSSSNWVTELGCDIGRNCSTSRLFCKGRKSCKEKRFSEKHTMFWGANAAVIKEAKGHSASQPWACHSGCPHLRCQGQGFRVSQPGHQKHSNSLSHKWLKFTFHF